MQRPLKGEVFHAIKSGGIISPAPPVPTAPVPTALLAGSVCVRCCLEQLLSFSWKGQDRSLILSFFSQRRKKSLQKPVV